MAMRVLVDEYRIDIAPDFCLIYAKVNAHVFNVESPFYVQFLMFVIRVTAQIVLIDPPEIIAVNVVRSPQASRRDRCRVHALLLKKPQTPVSSGNRLL